MSVLDLFRNEYVNGKVVDKYRLTNGNLGLVVEDGATRRRYDVEFRDNYKGPSSENLFGLLKKPFAGKTEYLDHLVEAGDSIDLTLSYSRGPFREAYHVHSVSRAEPRQSVYRSPTKLIDLPYRHGADVTEPYRFRSTFLLHRRAVWILRYLHFNWGLGRALPENDRPAHLCAYN
jgi:hypothetical protein